jgi:hypothetical protein
LEDLLLRPLLPPRVLNALWPFCGVELFSYLAKLLPYLAKLPPFTLDLLSAIGLLVSRLDVRWRAACGAAQGSFRALRYTESFIESEGQQATPPFLRPVRSADQA